MKETAWETTETASEMKETARETTETAWEMKETAWETTETAWEMNSPPAARPRGTGFQPVRLAP